MCIRDSPKSNPIIPIIALMYSYFSKILLVHHSQDKSDKGIAAKLKVNPFFAKDYIFASKNYKISSVVFAIEAIHKADLQSKGVIAASGSQGEILKELIFTIMHS